MLHLCLFKVPRALLRSWGLLGRLPCTPISVDLLALLAISRQSLICAFPFLGMAEPIYIVVVLRACDLWCACDLCFLRRVGGFGFGYIMLDVALVVLFRGVLRNLASYGDAGVSSIQEDDVDS